MPVIIKVLYCIYIHIYIINSNVFYVYNISEICAYILEYSSVYVRRILLLLGRKKCTKVWGHSIIVIIMLFPYCGYSSDIHGNA